VGAQIGIHNLRGEKVGTVSHTRNTEYLYVASDRPVTAAIADLAGRIHGRTVGAGDA
jgi:adenine-specific DNA-methyltransferase